MLRLEVVASGLALALSVGCSNGSSSGPPDRLTTFQAADLVIGQPDFVSGSANQGSSSASAAGVEYPVGDAQGVSGGLALPDTYNHRLLVYRSIPSANGTAADSVLGQSDATSNAPSHSTGRFHYPQSVGVSGSALIVADSGASRIVLGAGADNVTIGWGDGSTCQWGCAVNMLSEPSRAIVVAGKLIVADRSNHRILIWKQIPASGVSADLVLGQQDLTHCAANDMVGAGNSGGRTATTLRYPTDVWSDGTRLLVVDQGNNRVLLWNHFPTSNAAAADVVLGQPDFLVARAEATQVGLNWPVAVASDGQSIFVADARNHRVLVWRSFPSANGQAADLVLGQGDFSHGAPNDDNQDGQTEGPTARTMNTPMGVALVGDYLVVTDTYNHRFLLFRRH